jgi:hypothetical protein
MKTRLILPVMLCAASLLPGFCFTAVAELAPRGSGLKSKSNLIREKGSIYLEDVTDKQLKLLVNRPTFIYYTPQMDRLLGTLFPGQEVEIVALTEKLYKVRGKARQGLVKGWVKPSTLASLDKNFVENLKKLHERETMVAALIEKNEVALGMTPEEVLASLGKPDKKTSKLTKAGRSETFEFATFTRVPRYVPATRKDEYGRLIQYTAVVYEKVQTGFLRIAFEGNVASSIEENQDNTIVGGRPKIVPGPIVLF